MQINNGSTSPNYQVIMQPIGRRAYIQSGQTLLDAAQSAGVELVSICGGAGVCEGCKVRLMSGKLSSPSSIEQEVFTSVELEKGYRLACQAFPESDIKIDIPPESLSTPQRLQIEGKEVSIPSEPSVLEYELDIEPPKLIDLRSDATRLKDTLLSQHQLANVDFEYSTLSNISTKLRESKWRITAAIRDKTIISIFPTAIEEEDKKGLVGLAVDVGTTKLAAYLVDLKSGSTRAKIGAMNPQIAFGEDVISRITYANRSQETDKITGRKILQQRLIQTLNDMISEMCKNIHGSDGSIRHHQIVDAVVVGNTAMHHLFAGYPIKQLGEAPYVPAVSDATEILARDIGLDIAPGANIYLPPNIAGYVGADHIAMLLATIFNPLQDYANSDQTIIALDIGTNTEISLMHRGSLVCCSCASGPAFEGAHIRDGMRAAPGAIERVKIEGDTIWIKTINGQPPVGICGSGILDTIAEMLNSDILDRRGAINQNHTRVKTFNGNYGFLLTDAADSGHGQDIVITRKDVNEIQLAKGAIRAGIEILLTQFGVETKQIDHFIVAGAFGTYIDIRSAIRVGMFPDIDIERFHQVGNAAGSGAKQMLISKSQRMIAQEFIKKVQYIELSNHPGFTNEFSKALFFPEAK
jgi:uncharacterized 2Fe-2S/4Fe-4S cluster protein (DUF4445 family)